MSAIQESSNNEELVKDWAQKAEGTADDKGWAMIGPVSEKKRPRKRLPAAKRKLEKKVQELLDVCFAYLEAEAADSVRSVVTDPELHKEDEA